MDIRWVYAPVLSLFLVMTVGASGAAAAGPEASGQADFYVATNGNDAWSGRLAAPNRARTDGPFATLGRARDAVREARVLAAAPRPYTVLIRGGTYALSRPIVFGPEDSGAEGAPITYAAYPKEKPVFSGGQVITGWRKDRGTPWWSVRLPEVRDSGWTFRELFVNGKRRTLARSPNEGYYYVAGKAGPLKDPQSGQEIDASKLAFRFKPGEIKRWPRLSDINAVIFFHWETGMLRIKSVDEESNTVVFTGPMKWPFWTRQRYFIENVFEALDAPGEWYLHTGRARLYYIPEQGEDLSRATVVAPMLTQLVLLAGDPDAGKFVEQIKLQGLSFEFADYALEPEGHCDWQSAVTIPAVVQARGARFCTVEDCEVAHVGQYGIWLEGGCTDNRIVRNHLHDLGAGGIRIGRGGIAKEEAAQTGRNLVSNNFIHDAGHVYPGANGIWIGQSSDNTISHNEICDVNYTAISCGWTWGYGPTQAHRNLIEYNHLHHIGRGVLSDMGGIYTLGTSPGTKIRNNLIHDVWCYAEGYGAGGIYPDEGSSQILIENNVVYRTISGGLTIHYGKDNIARNNIFALGRDGQIGRGRKDKGTRFTFEHNIVYFTEGQLFRASGDVTADYNVYYQAKGEPIEFPGGLSFEEWQAQGQDVHSLVADPGFVDAKHFDFRLKPDSPALKLGFEPIDSTKAGLFGPREWVELPRRIKRPAAVFPRRPERKPVLIDDGFERDAVGATADLARTHGETAEATIRVTDEVAATGKHSLKFTDAAGLDQPWNPHLYYSPHLTDGLVRESFDLRFEPGALIWIEWRDASQPYIVGPSMGLDADGQLTAREQTVMSLPANQWVHFEIVCGLGKHANGTYDLTVTVPGREPKRLEKLPCDPRFKRLEWLGFVSNATGPAVFYLDNLKLNRKKR